MFKSLQELVGLPLVLTDKELELYLPSDLIQIHRENIVSIIPKFYTLLQNHQILTMYYTGRPVGLRLSSTGYNLPEQNILKMYNNHYKKSKLETFIRRSVHE